MPYSIISHIVRSLPTLVLSFTLTMLSSQSARSNEPVIESYCLGNAIESCFVYIDGPITKDIADDLSEFAPSIDAPAIYLNSPGGDLQEALRIGRVIRATGRLQTKIGSLEGVEKDEFGRPTDFPKNGKCESACAYAFMGGQERRLGSGKLGLHRFYSTERGLTSDEAQFLSGILVEYMVEMGVDARLFLAASKEGADGMYYVSEAEALDYAIVTPYGYGDVFLEPYLGGIVAASRRLDPPKAYDHVKQVTFFCEQGRPKVMLTADAGYLERSPINILPKFAVSRNESQEINLDNLTVRDIGDISLLTFEIPRALHSRIFIRRGNVWDFRVNVTYSRASGGNYGAGLSMSEMDLAMVKSAFRHCIR
ncbi:MAG: hypothetical protein JXQ89_12320 [Pelagimonas sp.]